LSTNHTDNVKSDGKLVHLLWGAKAISREIDATPRQTFYMLENSLIRAKRSARVGAQVAMCCVVISSSRPGRSVNQ
jgi:hypothetical protein